MGHLDSIESKGIKTVTFNLQPLDISQVKYLISETLRSNDVDSLAQIVCDRTKGNPFFVGRFLSVLYSKRILVSLTFVDQV